MFVELDGDGATYQQLTRALKHAILGGKLGAGTRLPPTRTLAQELGLSRITVVSAYDQLRAEGYLKGRVGAGSFVSELQLTPRLRPTQADSVIQPSRYAERARHLYDPLTRLHRGLRFDLQYGDQSINPTLNAIWARELARAAARTPLERGPSAGLPALRTQVAAYLGRRRGIEADPDQILIVNGAQSACDLTAKVLLNEGDRVVIEDPHYFGLRHTLDAHGIELKPVRTDDEGLICAELPSTAPRVICVTPSHQFPAGPPMSLPRRLELLRYAQSNSCWILEDDYGLSLDRCG